MEPVHSTVIKNFFWFLVILACRYWPKAQDCDVIAAHYDTFQVEILDYETYTARLNDRDGTI